MNSELGENMGDSSSLMKDIIVHENDLTDQAKSRFSDHDDILDAFELNRRSILENDQMTTCL